MTAYDALVRCAGSFNIAIVSGAALGYVQPPDWVLHLNLWPALFFCPLFALIAVVEFIRERVVAAQSFRRASDNPV